MDKFGAAHQILSINSGSQRSQIPLSWIQKSSFCTFEIEFLRKIEFLAFSANQVFAALPKK